MKSLKMRKFLSFLGVLASSTGVLSLEHSSIAQAEILNYTHFVSPGKFALAVEPQLIVTRGAGLGVNARYTQGLNDLMNASINLGNGSGPRQARLGAALTLDFFPDVDKQPGIGVTAQLDYVNAPRLGRDAYSTEMASQVEVLGIPYIHKAAVFQNNEVDPFLALPVGMFFQSNQYRWKSNLVVGSQFKITSAVRTSLELGFNLSNSDSYISGGLTYYH